MELHFERTCDTEKVNCKFCKYARHTWEWINWRAWLADAGNSCFRRFAAITWRMVHIETRINNTSVSERLTSIFLSPIPRLFVCLQDREKWIVWNNVLFENALEGSQLLNYLTASAPLLDWCEVLIIALREVNHHVLAALRQLPHTPARRPRIPGKNISFNCTIDNLTC